MKTAMQELIDWSYENDKSDCPIEAYDIIKKAKEFLEKEKEQIIDFGYKCRDNQKKLPQDIFNQTYNLNKLTIKTKGKVGLSNPDETTNNKLNINQNK